MKVGSRLRMTRMGLLLSACLSTSMLQGKAERSIRWTALSSTAMAITGDLKTTDSTVILEKARLDLTLIRKFGEVEIGDAAKLFITKPDNRAHGELYRTYLAPNRKLQNGNTLCGKSEVSWVVELQDGKDLYLAFFSGDQEPNLTPAIVDNSLNLCGAYWYEKTAR